MQPLDVHLENGAHARVASRLAKFYLDIKLATVSHGREHANDGHPHDDR